MDAYDARGSRITLDDAGKAGGEGSVHAVAGSRARLVKLFHPQRLTTELRDKIDAMTANPPDDPTWSTRRHRSIAWPEQPVFADAARTRFAGYAMPAVDTRTFREAHTYYDPQDRLVRFGGAFTWRHLLTAAANLASAVGAVHAQGHRIGDLRETNILVSPNALVTLIDCDSFQVHDSGSERIFYTRVGSPEYLPRELHGADFADDHDRTDADRFALAVLIFRFLMQGVHPFQARGATLDDAPTTEAKIARGAFPYVRRRVAISPPAFAPPWDVLPPRLRRSFARCFVGGHRRPARRPTADEWIAALRTEAARLRRCRRNPNHWHGGHTGRCPWCAIARDTGVDPFPAPGTAAAAAPTATVARPAPAPPSSSSSSLPVSTSQPRAPARPGRSLRAITRLRPSPRRALAAVGIAMLPALLISPLGHGAEQPRERVIPSEQRARGSCPTRDGAAPAGCASAWRLGDIARIDIRERTFFIVTSTQTLIEIPFRVTHRASGTSCALPWLEHLAFNEKLPPVCLGECPVRIELRDHHGRTGRLVAADGAGARGDPVACGERVAGSWTFDATGLEDPVVLRYPAFGEIRLPRLNG